MLGNEAMEFLKTLHKLDEIWKQHDNAEYNDRQLTQFAERYHKHKLKLLGIADVVGRSEQLVCPICSSDNIDAEFNHYNFCRDCNHDWAK